MTAARDIAHDIDRDAARADLAPAGSLRAGINTMNMLLVTGATDGDPTGGDPTDGDLPVGVAPDMAAAVADALDASLTLIPLPSPAAVADAATEDVWDIGLIAAEPKRAEVIDFTAPYVEIEATYLVPDGSPIRSVEEIDRPGAKIAVSGRSAYDLYLTRTVRHAELIRGDGLDGAAALFREGGFDALAGLRPALIENVADMPGARILDGRFTAVAQAIGTQKGKTAGLAFVEAFVAEAKSNGLVRRLIDKHGVTGKLAVAG